MAVARPTCLYNICSNFRGCSLNGLKKIMILLKTGRNDFS